MRLMREQNALLAKQLGMNTNPSAQDCTGSGGGGGGGVKKPTAKMKKPTRKELAALPSLEDLAAALREEVTPADEKPSVEDLFKATNTLCGGRFSKKKDFQKTFTTASSKITFGKFVRRYELAELVSDPWTLFRPVGKTEIEEKDLAKMSVSDLEAYFETGSAAPTVTTSVATPSVTMNFAAAAAAAKEKTGKKAPVRKFCSNTTRSAASASRGSGGGDGGGGGGSKPSKKKKVWKTYSNVTQKCQHMTWGNKKKLQRQAEADARAAEKAKPKLPPGVSEGGAAPVRPRYTRWSAPKPASAAAAAVEPEEVVEVNPTRKKLPQKLKGLYNKLLTLFRTHHRRYRGCKISKQAADELATAVIERTTALIDGVTLSEKEREIVEDVRASAADFLLFTELNGRTSYDGRTSVFGPTDYVSSAILEQALRGELPGQREMRDDFDDECVLKREWRRERSLIAKLERDVENGDASAQRLLDRIKAERNKRVRILAEARKAVEDAGKKGKANAERHLAKVEEKVSKELLKAARQKHNESVHGRVYAINDPEYTAKCRAEVEGRTDVPEECRAKHIPPETMEFVRHGPISDIWKHWNSCVDAFQTAKDVHGEDASSKKIYGLPRSMVDVVHELRKSGKMP